MTPKQEWYETFFSGLYGRVLGSDMHEGRAPEEAGLAKRLLKLRKGQRVLDCPCGLGRMARGLAGLGLDVTGTDLAATYVQRARRRAASDGLRIRFVRCDMRELPFDGEFDAVVNWFTSFGYFDDDGNLAAARAALRALKPGGKFLIETMNKSSLLARFNPGRRETVINGVTVVNRARWDAKGSRVRDPSKLSSGSKTQRTTISIRVYNAADMRSLLREAGFQDVKLFGRPPLGRFTKHSRRMIAVATRPE